MKPDLRNVTLVCYENRDHATAINLMAHQSRLVDLGDIRLLNWFQGREQFIYWENFETWRYVTTSHMLSIHLDGYIINPHLWNPDWLQYDYIGAPWPTEINSARVGNGGFSLKSRRLLNRISSLPWINMSSDGLVCNHYRDLLVSEGFSFAPIEIAARFSVEYRISEAPVETFGFHATADGYRVWEAQPFVDEVPVDNTSDVDLRWLTRYGEDVLGPIQRDEAIFLYGLARTIRAQRVLEFGSHLGHSARLWLEAGAQQVVCVECAPTEKLRALASDSNGRLRIVAEDMAELSGDQLQGPWDIVFFDAGHSVEINRTVFERLRTRWKRGMLIVHDTGLWSAPHMRPHHEHFPGEWTAEGFAHQAGERAFAAWLKEIGLSRIDVHSRYTLRHGLSLFSFSR